MDIKPKLPWFIRLTSGQVFNRSEIKSVRKTSPTVGKDKVERCWVVQVSAESAGGPAYTRIWLTDEEGRRVCQELGVDPD